MLAEAAATEAADTTTAAADCWRAAEVSAIGRVTSGPVPGPSVNE